MSWEESQKRTEIQKPREEKGQEEEFQHEECAALYTIRPGLNFVVQTMSWEIGEKEGWSHHEGWWEKTGVELEFEGQLDFKKPYWKSWGKKLVGIEWGCVHWLDVSIKGSWYLAAIRPPEYGDAGKWDITSSAQFFSLSDLCDYQSYFCCCSEPGVGVPYGRVLISYCFISAA